MEFPEARILVFAKAPVPGQVKTRMIPALDGAAAADLHARLTRHALTSATSADLAPVELWCTPDTAHPFFTQLAQDFPISLHRQQGDDLGQRMGHALQTALQSFPYALVIGTDCPTLGVDALRQALTMLWAGSDAVIGPAADGGYVLLGLRRYDPLVFEGIKWGTASVLEATRARLRQLGWQWGELEQHSDIDRPEDLERVPRAIRGASGMGVEARSDVTTNQTMARPETPICNGDEVALFPLVTGG